MSAPLARLVRILAALLWLSGVAWLVLHYGFREATEFGYADSPYLSPTRIAHGVLALVCLPLAGWVGADHAWPRWTLRRRRASGAALVAWCLVASISGFGLFYATSDVGRTWTSVGHQFLGVAGIAFALVHMRTSRSARTTGPGTPSH